MSEFTAHPESDSEDLKPKPIAGIVAIILAIAALSIAVLTFESSGENHPVYPTNSSKEVSGNYNFWEKAAPRVILALGGIAILLAVLSYFREKTKTLSVSAGGIAVLACAWNIAMFVLAVLAVCALIYGIMQVL